MPRKATEPAADSVSADLYEQPGHLIRRAHQIANAVFSEMVSNEVTPLQYAILRMVHENPGTDQVTLASLVALDTSTTALTAARLEGKGLLVREVAAHNRRQLQLSLTKAGETLIVELVDDVHRMREHLLAALDPKEQQVFMTLMRKFVHLHNEQSRAPLRRARRKSPRRPPRRRRPSGRGPGSFGAAADRTHQKESPGHDRRRFQQRKHRHAAGLSRYPRAFGRRPRAAR
ncbi:MarR family transcriptional regulator [Ramlibacter terrae]|uniref:MarR family transcriptional regulator n=1 Tax=Ramlibacter terrae TaxID=2732511 RepID=A0ABX6P326_9BURK|nr:MarR family transcriptional regulator [Ramlibacter terrae]